jgi:hypothetical protein
MSILFPDPVAAALSFRSTMAFGMGSNINLSALSDSDIVSSINAAEAEASHQLRVLFQPTVILPNEATQAEMDALTATATPFMQEASYDYDPEFFIGNRWGYIITKQSPIISVQSINFAYPSPAMTVFSIPDSWVRMDKKYGQIRLVPATQPFSAPLTAFVMQALGGGKTIPFMIQLRYTAGLANPAADYPDLVDTVKKMAMMRILQSAFLPASGSISADGLSRSKSFDYDKWQGMIDHKLDELRDLIHGIRMTTLGVA